MSQDLLLKQFTANSFMGISSDKPVIIYWERDAKKNQRITKFAGNQGEGKTSTMTGLMYAMAAAFDINTSNFFNNTDQAIDETLNFEYNGEDEKLHGEYTVVASGTRFILKKHLGGDKFTNVGEPKTILRKMFGNLGVSPMFLKEKDGKKQITWFKETFGTDADATKKEIKITTDLKKKFESRTETNREIKSLKGWLDENPLYQKYEQSQIKYGKPINAEKEKKKFDELSEKKSSYQKYQHTITLGEADIKDAKSRIEKLKKDLKAEEDRLAGLEEAHKKGTKWLEDNKNVLADYETANTAWLNLSKDMAAQASWKEVLKKEKEYNEKTEESTQQTADIDKYRADLLKLTKSYLPDIPGLSIHVKTGLDDDKEEGIYYQDKTLAMLSESELWGLFMQIWAAKDVQFIFCENINSLGSDAVKILNKLVKEGAYVFASEMDRSKNHMEITFETKIV